MTTKRIITIFQQKYYTFEAQLSEDYSCSIEQKVTLKKCDTPTQDEQSLIENQTTLFHHSRQWLNGIESEDYVGLCHSQLIESIRKYPGSYLTAHLKLPHDMRSTPSY